MSKKPPKGRATAQDLLRRERLVMHLLCMRQSTGEIVKVLMEEEGVGERTALRAIESAKKTHLGNDEGYEKRYRLLDYQIGRLKANALAISDTQERTKMEIKIIELEMKLAKQIEASRKEKSLQPGIQDEELLEKLQDLYK